MVRGCSVEVIGGYLRVGKVVRREMVRVGRRKKKEEEKEIWR